MNTYTDREIYKESAVIDKSFKGKENSYQC